MLTPDQAHKAAFYAAANLLSFTDERANNLDWMGVREPHDRWAVNDVAAAFVRSNRSVAFVASDPQTTHVLGIETLAAALQSYLFCRDLIEAVTTRSRFYSYYVFVSVLLAGEALIAIESAAAEATRIREAPVPVASAYELPEEDRIDGGQPDPFALSAFGTALPATAAKTRRGK